MNSRIAAAVMCTALAGCAGCGGATYDLAGKSVVRSPESAQYCYPADEELAGNSEDEAAEAPAQKGASWGMAKLIKAPVEDLRGRKVAEIDDLLISPDGRINTAVLTVTDDTGGTRTITVPFKDLKRSVDPNGNYTIRTTQLTKPDRKAPAKSAPAQSAPAKSSPAKDGGK